MAGKPEPSLSQVIEFKAGNLPAFAALLRSIDREQLTAALQGLLDKTPDFFDGEPAVLDFSQLKAQPETVDWPALLALFRQYRLAPVAASGLPEPLAAAAREAGLAVLSGNALRTRTEKRAPEKPAAAPPAPQPAPGASPTMVIDRPLRSGQQVYARGGDLVLLAMVSAGAEVIADGNIHVYAALRGRALAGAGGNANARIFTTSFEAELVSIAGVYRTFEGGLPEALARQPAQVRLHADGNGAQQVLSIAPLITK